MQAHQFGMSQSSLEVEIVQPTDGSRTPDLAGKLVIQEQRLHESPTYGSTSFNLPDMASRVLSERDLFKTFAQLPDSNTHYDGGYYTIPIESWIPFYPQCDATVYNNTKEIMVFIKPNKGKIQYFWQNLVRASINAGAYMDARTDTWSFYHESALPKSIYACGEGLVRSSDLERYATRYQHTQVYHCGDLRFVYKFCQEDTLGSHYKARHGFDMLSFVRVRPKPKKDNLKGENPKLGLLVQEDRQEMIHIVSRTIIGRWSEASASDAIWAQASGQPPKAGIPFRPILHRYLLATD